MKKIFTVSMLAVFTIAGVAEAKGLKVGRSSSMSRPAATAPSSTANSANTNVYGQSVSRPATPAATTPTTSANTANAASANAAAQPARSGVSLGSVAAGAAAGYLLSEALTPSTAHAETPAAPAGAQQTAPSAQMVTGVPEFKSLSPQDPYLIEQTVSYRRWCLNGVQYISGVNSSQFTPLINTNGTPMLCRVVM